MSRLDQWVLHIPTITLRFSAPIQRDFTTCSNKPSRFGELLKKMVMALYVFNMLYAFICLHDNARDKFELWLQQWVTIAFGDSLRTNDAAPFFLRLHVSSTIITLISTLSNFNANVIVKLDNSIPNCFSSYSFQFYKFYEYFTNFIAVIDISQADRYSSLEVVASSAKIE